MEIEKRVDALETQITTIKHDCEKHRTSTRDVLNEILCIKDELSKLKSSFKDIKDVKRVVDSINTILIQRATAFTKQHQTVKNGVIVLLVAVVFWLLLSVFSGGFILP